MCGECNWPIPKDQWVEIPNEKLKKKGITEFIYVSSAYEGPIAMDATIKEKKEDE